MSTQTLSKTAVLSLLLLLYAGIIRADLLPNFGTDDEDLWKSGTNLYIRLTDQDKSKKDTTPPNQHPVQLNAGQDNQCA